MQSRFYILLFSLMMMGWQLDAQQVIQFSQYQNTTSFYHPGSVGLDQSVDLAGLYRTQWVGIDGNAQSQYFSAAFPLFDINSGAGIVISNDAIGLQKDLSIRGIYNYQYELGEGKLSAGIFLGYLQKGLNGNEMITPTGNYEPGTQNHNDPILPEGNQSAGTYEFGFGVYYQDDHLEVGLSGHHIPSGDAEFDGSANPFEISHVQQLVLSSFYKWEIANKFDLRPMINLKTDFNNHQAEFGVLTYYDEFIWGGISYRGYNNFSSDAVIAMLGVEITDKLDVGYSYDYTVSQLSAVSTGSHELFIKYSIPVLLPSKGKIINNPRFLPY